MPRIFRNEKFVAAINCCLLPVGNKAWLTEGATVPSLGKTI